jgi:hypothetical protein
MAMANDTVGDPRIDEAKQFLKLANDGDTMNRQEALEDMKFVGGEQWPVELQNSRNLESRPVLTINKLDGYCRQVVNQIKQQRPRPKVHGMNSQSDEKVAEVIQGIIRHIEANSRADVAYDTAADYAVRMGWGYIRLRTDYVSEDSFDQEIFIDAVDNPFTVYYDINSVAPDGSDAERCLITTMMRKADFEKLYPNSDTMSFLPRGTGDSQSEWITKEDIRLAEYFYTVKEKADLYLLSDGTSTFAEDKDFFKRLEAVGVTVVDKRPSYKKTVKWCKLTAVEVLEERTLPGRYIPVVPVYGRHIVIGDKRHKFGMVRYAKDPQRMYNFWQTSLTESVALAPKAKWLMAEGQDEGHENDWAQANIKSFPLLRYKQTDIDGQPAQPPQRLQPEPPPEGILAATGLIDNDIKTMMGIFDPAQLKQGNISGKALNGQQQQVDLSNFDFYDNLTISQAQVARIILNWIPEVYDTQRVMRIIGDDGRPDTVTINERNEIGQVMNDVTVGLYDVVMDTGPGYNSRREAAVEAMTPILASDPNLMAQIGDLWFRNQDFPGADIIADRLATINPLAQIDEKSDIPPQAQMMIKQSQEQVKQLQQQLQALQLTIKQRQDIEQVKQEAETKRVLIKETNRAHDIELRDQERHTDMRMKVDAQAHDTVLKTQTQLEIEQMKAQVAILLAEMDRRALRDASAETTERAI